MPHWIKLWRDWVGREILRPFQRPQVPRPHGLAFSYEKAGITVRDEPIPWNTDAVQLEALVRFPGQIARRRADFQLLLMDHTAIAASSLHRTQEEDYRVLFKLPPLEQTAIVELSWRGQPLAQVLLPVITPHQFVDGFQVKVPTVSVRLGEAVTVACQAYVCNQGKGIIASGLLSSTTSLVPLLDLDLAVEFIDQRTGDTQHVPVRLAASQLAQREALVNVVAPRRPRRLGDWIVQWTLAGRVLARQQLKVLGQKSLKRVVSVSETRYVRQDRHGEVHITKQLPKLNAGDRLGPCYLLGSRIPGLAALVPLKVQIQTRGGFQFPLTQEEVLISDGPLPYVPGTVSAGDLEQILAFTLHTKGEALGFLSSTPAPVAHFTSEGSYMAPVEDFLWTPAADEELANRLGKLAELS